MAFSGPKHIRFGIVFLLALLIVNGLLSYRALRILRDRRAELRAISEDRQQLEHLASLLKDAETGQRGFIFTGDEQYLKPYTDSVPELRQIVNEKAPRFLTSENEPESERQVDTLVTQKLDELARTIELKRAGRTTELRSVIDSGKGKQLMDDFRSAISRLEADQQRRLTEGRIKQDEADSYLVATLAFASATAFMFVLLFAAALNREAQRVRELQNAEKLATTGRMAATVAHEINNPLEAATNLVYLATTNELTPEPVKRLLDLADRELARVAHMTKQTLGFYRSATTAQVFSAVEMMDEMVRLFDSKLQGKGLIVERLFRDDPKILGNRGEIFQVMTNLFSNAIDASHQRGTITLSIEADSSGTSISVDDQGVGVPKNFEQKMFEAFSTTKKDVGTGLGLWVANKLVAKHGGRITVASTASGRSGARFTVWLPRTDVAERGSNAAASSG